MSLCGKLQVLGSFSLEVIFPEHFVADGEALAMGPYSSNPVRCIWVWRLAVFKASGLGFQ